MLFTRDDELENMRYEILSDDFTFTAHATFYGRL